MQGITSPRLLLPTVYPLSLKQMMLLKSVSLFLFFEPQQTLPNSFVKKVSATILVVITAGKIAICLVALGSQSLPLYGESVLVQNTLVNANKTKKWLSSMRKLFPWMLFETT